MLDWDKVKNDRALLKRAEKIVNKVSHVHYDFPEDICDELNRLTGNDWSGDDYIDYCAEYWETLYSLEAVVYALFHDGEYPQIDEKMLTFIKPLDKSILPTLEVCHKLCTAKPDDSYREQFEPLPVSDLKKWFTKRFKGWKRQIETKKDKMDGSGCDYGETSLHFEYKGKTEYGYQKNIRVFLSNDRSGFISSEGLSPEEWEDVLNYFKIGYTFTEK